MKKLLFVILTLFLLNNPSFSQSHKIIESTANYIKIEFNFENGYQLTEKKINEEIFFNIEGGEVFLREPGEPWLPSYTVNIGIPFNADPVVKILNSVQEKIQNVFILPTPDSLNQEFNFFPYDKEIYNVNNFYPVSSAEIQDFIMRYARIANLIISPYQFNPVSRELLFNKKIILQVDFKTLPGNNAVVNKINDKMTEDLIKSTLVNYEVAKEFTGKPVYYDDAQALGDTYWYNPQKDYFKIYLNKKGVYRITYDMLIGAGVPSLGIQNNTLELINMGNSIPIDVVDNNNDGFFNEGDYFQFVGEPAKPVDQFTRMNIYNLTNVYWFSYQADTLNYYNYIDGFPPPSAFPNLTNSVETLRWEIDQVYNNLGHAVNDQRDYWYWGYAEVQNRVPTHYFQYLIQDSIWNDFNPDKPQARIKIGLHGLTKPTCGSGSGFAHNADIYFNGKVFGSIQWDDQEIAIFDKEIYLSYLYDQGGDTVHLNWQDYQNLIVYLNGNICNNANDDFILVNYVELEYWRWNKSHLNYFYFTSPPNDLQQNRYYVSKWERDNMKIYIPTRGKLIDNPLITNDADLSVQFVDTINQRTDYYC
ncbi:MAG TPA: C25 family peptidase propeptide domain-containing protein, partial [Ignavibacteriaceae bacterium]|nr:C25 family peptidase propeptide domain-containing protein [Ignavibacteriaceae bacterium]